VNFKDRSIVAAAAVYAAARRLTPSSAWITHLIGLSALVGLLAVLNAQAIAAAVQLWWRSPTFSHCFLVILVSAYFVWRRRHVANGYRALGIVRASRPLERQPHRPWRRSHHLWLGYADPISTEESGAPALLYWQSHRPSHVSTAAFSAPPTPEGWQTGAISDGWSPNYAAPDARLAFAVHKAGSIALDVDVFVNYYAGGNGSHNLVSSAKKLSVQGVWRPLSQGTAEAVLGGRMVHLGEAVISSAGLTRMIWWTYWSGGRFTASGLDVKLDRLRHALSGGGSALVAVSTPVDVDNGEVRARLRRALGALGGIAARLEEARRS
jgi:EpsI family protein